MFVVYTTIPNRGNVKIAAIEADEHLVKTFKEAIEAEYRHIYDYVDEDTWQHWRELQIEEDSIS